MRMAHYADALPHACQGSGLMRRCEAQRLRLPGTQVQGRGPCLLPPNMVPPAATVLHGENMGHIAAAPDLAVRCALSAGAMAQGAPSHSGHTGGAVGTLARVQLQPQRTEQ